VINLALYVRIQRSVSEEKVVPRGGLLDRLADFAAYREGRGEYKWDNEEIVGHRNAVTLNETGLEKLYDGHTVGKLLKSYHMANPEKQHSGEPTYHPKVEVQFASGYSGDSTVPWDADHMDVSDGMPSIGIDELRAELDEYLLSALHWAGLSTRATPEHYVEDEYWTLQEDDREVTIHEDPTEAVREVEQDLAVHHVAREDVTAGERAVLKALTDGGREMHHEELADASGTSSSTVYRAAEKFANVVRVANGTLSLEDEVIHEKLRELFAGLEERAEWVKRGIQDLVERDGLVSEDSALARWTRRYAVAITEDRDGMTVELTGRYSKHEIQRTLRAGYEAARATGANTATQFTEATFAWTTDDGDRRSNCSPFTVWSGSQLRVLGAPIGSIG
jgi:hypothetical protein